MNSIKIRSGLAKWLGVGAVGVFSIWFYSTPYLTIWEMQKAAASKDATALSKHIDYPALRESLKITLQEQMAKSSSQSIESGDPFAAMGTTLAQTLINPIIDAIVTPKTIAALLKGSPMPNLSDGRTASEAPSQVDINMSYESFNTFLITVKPKGSAQEPLSLVYRRDGFSWKLTGIRLSSPR